MGSRDPRTDAYIAKAAPFAQPILAQLRELVHAACPQATETIKWGMPFFEHQGSLCHMAAFKAHCAFGFWKGALVVDEVTTGAMGQLGRITSLAELPPKKTLTAWIKKAVALNEAGIQKVRAAKPPKPVLVPELLTASLRENAKALATYQALSPSGQREYADWISEAKTEATRERRLAQALQWLAEGKSRNWKYQNC